MRKFTNVLLLALAVMLIAAACSSSDSAGDLDGRTVRVAVENAYPPYNFIPEGATEGEGWDYDAWNEICSRLNCTAEFVEAGWPAVIVETGQGQYDTAADGISIIIPTSIFFLNATLSAANSALASSSSSLAATRSSTRSVNSTSLKMD